MTAKKQQSLKSAGMQRADELIDGRVCVLGGRKSVAAIMHALIEECGGDVPAVVLCHDAGIAARSARKEDSVVVIGRNAEAGERFPELLEPWILSPETGASLDSIVGALSSGLAEDLPVLNTNDAYWTASARRVFETTIRACLLGMKWTRSFDIAHFARFHQKIFDEFPRMVANDPAKDTYSYPYSAAWVKAFRALGDYNPFGELLTGVHPSTAQITLNCCCSMTGAFRSLLKRIPEERKEGESRLSICDYLSDHRGGRLFLVLPRGMKSVASAFFRFFIAGLEVAHRNCGEPRARLIIPDASAWREPAVLNTLLQDGSDDLSILWGASNLIQLNIIGKSKGNIAQSMTVFSESRVWSRTGDPAAEEVYRMLVPESRRLYPLAEIPRMQCFIESPYGDFGGVALPSLPEVRSGKADFGGGKASDTPLLWKDLPEDGFPGEDDEEEEVESSASYYNDCDCPIF